MDILIVLLTVVGTAFCITEIFVSGFGFFGIAGIIAVASSITLSIVTYDVPIYLVFITQLVLIVGVHGVIYFIFKKFNLDEKIILKESLKNDEKIVDKKQYFEKTGTSLTPLKPVGNISIDGHIIEALSMGEYINKGKNVKVKKVANNKIFVEEICEEE